MCSLESAQRPRHGVELQLHSNQQYIPYTENNDNKASGKQSENSKSSDGSSNRKVVISAPAATITSSVEKAASFT
ncbi:hypothetical protein NC653_010953 [Populus alba x Populus x berolinensis]|uniref:Uncharacterized protein n=1 Tax=Populus alba x Populus x berolinensis TaxID=444605 RepID=A0AAD6R114_9ROSI|nr:hypothetical protein NC653_010953 [Populus alba x Populus x berolinensis]